MARVCEICGKSYQKAASYKKIKSKYDPTRIHKQKPNLVWVKLPHSNKKIRVCARCRKKLIKTR